MDKADTADNSQAVIMIIDDHGWSNSNDVNDNDGHLMIMMVV